MYRLARTPRRSSSARLAHKMVPVRAYLVHPLERIVRKSRELTLAASKELFQSPGAAPLLPPVT